MRASEFKDGLTQKIAEFLRGIGLKIEQGNVPGESFLPGLQIERGTLIVDEKQLAASGDLLHEAGHLAVRTAEQRAQASADMGADGGEEMAAIAWSYAAVVHLGLDAAVVFHEDGYRGGAGAILENFREGRYLGVPLLQWMGLTADAKAAEKLGIAPYPAMRKWLRE